MDNIWVETAGQAEIPLAGGDVTEGVVRVGDTVRRPVGPHSPLVHALLAHLESAGFEGAPRFLGSDEAGREVLSYIDGEVAGRPRPPWITDETRLASLGRLVRAYDDATASFTPQPDVLAGTSSAEPPGIPPAPAYPPEMIGHVDITPENVVFRNGRAYALIDFDLAKPATRADDSFDYGALRRVLLDPLGPGGDRRYQHAVYDMGTDTALSQPVATASADAVLLLDGVFLLRPELIDRWDLRIFVSAAFERALDRGRVRDLGRLGSIAAVERRFRDRYIPAQELYFAEARPADHADIIVHNDEPQRPAWEVRAD